MKKALVGDVKHPRPLQKRDSYTRRDSYVRRVQAPSYAADEEAAERLLREGRVDAALGTMERVLASKVQWGASSWNYAERLVVQCMVCALDVVNAPVVDDTETPDRVSAAYTFLDRAELVLATSEAFTGFYPLRCCLESLVLNARAGVLAEHSRDFESADRLLQRSQDLEGKAVSVVTLVNRATVLYAMGQLAPAALTASVAAALSRHHMNQPMVSGAADAAVEAQRTFRATHCAHLVHTHSLLSKVYWSMGQPDRAREYLSAAHTTALANFGDAHPITLKCREESTPYRLPKSPAKPPAGEEAPAPHSRHHQRTDSVGAVLGFLFPDVYGVHPPSHLLPYALIAPLPAGLLQSVQSVGGAQGHAHGRKGERGREKGGEGPHGLKLPRIATKGAGGAPPRASSASATTDPQRYMRLKDFAQRSAILDRKFVMQQRPVLADPKRDGALVPHADASVVPPRRPSIAPHPALQGHAQPPAHTPRPPQAGHSTAIVPHRPPRPHAMQPRHSISLALQLPAASVDTTPAFSDVPSGALRITNAGGASVSPPHTASRGAIEWRPEPPADPQRPGGRSRGSVAPLLISALESDIPSVHHNANSNRHLSPTTSPTAAAWQGRKATFFCSPGSEPGVSPRHRPSPSFKGEYLPDTSHRRSFVRRDGKMSGVFFGAHFHHGGQHTPLDSPPPAALGSSKVSDQDMAMFDSITAELRGRLAPAVIGKALGQPRMSLRTQILSSRMVKRLGRGAAARESTHTIENSGSQDASEWEEGDQLALIELYCSMTLYLRIVSGTRVWLRKARERIVVRRAEEEAAALLIQRHYRGYVSMQHAKGLLKLRRAVQLETRRKAGCTIAAVVEGYRARCRACVLHAGMMRRLAEQARLLQHQSRSATRIQAMWRRFAARRWYCTVLRSNAVLQRFVRLVACYRAAQAIVADRRRWRETYRVVRQAALTIQARWRSSECLRGARTEYLRRRVAINDHLAEQRKAEAVEYRAAVRTERDAWAVRLQQFVRARVSRAVVARARVERARRITAAHCLSRFWRVAAARLARALAHRQESDILRVLQRREIFVAAALDIQRCYRGHRGRAAGRTARGAAGHRTTCARTIQRVWAGYKGRARYAYYRHEAAQQRQQYITTATRQWSALRIQTAYRRHLAVRRAGEVRAARGVLHDMACVLQRFAKTCGARGEKRRRIDARRARRMEDRVREEEHTAAGAIQRAARAYLSRTVAAKRRMVRDCVPAPTRISPTPAASSATSSSPKSPLATLTSAELEHIVYYAVRIQTTWRRYRAMRAYRRVKVAGSGCVRTGGAWRVYNLRLEHQMEKWAAAAARARHASPARAGGAAAGLRGTVALPETRPQWVRQLPAQGGTRPHLLRGLALLARTEREGRRQETPEHADAASDASSSGYDTPSKDVRITQFLRIAEYAAVTVIEAWMRDRIDNHYLQRVRRLHRHSVYIKMLWRRACRKIRERVRRAATVIQRNWRRHTSTHTVARRRAAVRREMVHSYVLPLCVAGRPPPVPTKATSELTVAEESVLYANWSALFIQTVWRKHVAKRSIAWQMEARTLSLDEYSQVEEQVWAATLIQKTFRGHLVRRILKCCDEAARVIQSLLLVIRAKKLAERLRLRRLNHFVEVKKQETIAAAVGIQRAWRAYCRRMYTCVAQH